MWWLIKDFALLFTIAALAAATILSLYCANTLAHSRGEVPPSRLGIWITGIPLIVGLIPIAAFINPYIVMVRIRIFKIPHGPTIDPRVIAMGVSQACGENALSLLVFIFFLAVWLVLREWFRRRMVAAV